MSIIALSESGALALKVFSISSAKVFRFSRRRIINYSEWEKEGNMKEIIRRTAEETKDSYQKGDFGDTFDISGHETLVRMTKNKLDW